MSLPLIPERGLSTEEALLRLTRTVNNILAGNWPAFLVQDGVPVPQYAPGKVTFYVDAADGEPHAHVSFRFELTQGSATVSPTFTGYQVLAQPSGVRQRNIRLALLCQMKEGPVGRRTVERDVWPRVTALEAAERKGAVVVFQDFGTGEQRLVRIDKVQFVSQETPEQRPGRAQPGGVLLVTLVAVD